MRTKFRIEHAIAHTCSESHRARSHFFASRSKLASRSTRAIKFFFTIEKKFSITRDLRAIAVTSRKKSDELFHRASVTIPGAVNSPVRAWKAVGDAPIFIESGSGATIADADGNTFLPYFCSSGPPLLSHSPPRVLP